MKLESVIAANRFGLGARPGDLTAIGGNPQNWLLDQLQGPSRLPVYLRKLPPSSSALAEVHALRRDREKQRRAGAAGMANEYGLALRRHLVEQTDARYRTAATSDYPFFERLVHFWSNHFAVSVDKKLLPAIAGLYENEAIRPNVTGKFVDLLIAAEQHAAMILYLDNQVSIGPSSKLAKRLGRRSRNREIGINENLAREILELHTLGVDGGYTQQDVTSLAKVLTGWSIGGLNKLGGFTDSRLSGFQFRGSVHEPGGHRVMGKRYAQEGVKQGEAVLRDLAAHPSTARFLASKLARHFVADEPPETLIDKLADVYLETGGDLSSVYETLVTASESWKVAFAKFKSPHDFVISTFRAFDYMPGDPRFVVRALNVMGQSPFRPESPAGWPDTAEHWGGADALMKRIEWSNVVARRVTARSNPVEIGDAVLGPALAGQTRLAISRAESRRQGTILLLASPDFQRR